MVYVVVWVATQQLGRCKLANRLGEQLLVTREHNPGEEGNIRSVMSVKYVFPFYLQPWYMCLKEDVFIGVFTVIFIVDVFKNMCRDVFKDIVCRPIPVYW